MAPPDAEIKDGLSIPVWMKTKPPKDFEPFAASPPAPEDSFFYIRYPKTEVIFGKPKFSSDLPVIDKQKPEFSAAEITDVKDKDWSKHTKPCQHVLHSFGPINTAVPNLKPKPAGVDDGFKGEGAACGSSVVKVAHQMIQSKGSSRGFTVAAPADDSELSDSLRQKLMTRRNSRSLPATPASSPPGSPTSRRKMNSNRFFTSPYEPVEEFGSRSWLTMALLGFKKDLTTSTSTLAEEEYIDNRLQTGSLAESVENLGPAPKVEPTLPSTEPKAKSSQAYRPKPSELREMNFWSPTSM